MRVSEDDDVPSFSLKFSFQANMVFLLSMFIMALALGWALRDHKRRLLELATEEQEDRLYLTIIGILFVVTSLGSFYAFNNAGNYDDSERDVFSHNVLLEEAVRAFLGATGQLEVPKTPVPYVGRPNIDLPLPTSKQMELGVERDNLKKIPYDEYTVLAGTMFSLVVVVTIWYTCPLRNRVLRVSLFKALRKVGSICARGRRARTRPRRLYESESDDTYYYYDESASSLYRSKSESNVKSERNQRATTSSNNMYVKNTTKQRESSRPGVTMNRMKPTTGSTPKTTISTDYTSL